jgi:heme-binding protein
MIMKLSSITARRGLVGICASGLLGGLAATTIAAPTAWAAPEQCDASSLANTASVTTGSAHAYLDNHPDANQAVTAAAGQPRDQVAANLRNYFTAHPREYDDLRGILAPIGDAQRQCNVTLLPPDLASAYTEFMAG